MPHLVAFKVRGTFNEFTGSVKVNADAQTIIEAQATIYASSESTRNEKRDKHLRSPDFFAVDEYPEITFTSTSVIGSGDDIIMVGDLTMRGVTREAILQGAMVGHMTAPWGNNRAGFDETDGLVVGDKVQIGVEIEAFAEP